MHPHRRRKKRPNYGIRTVEVERGPNGFGFTISGQQPCILSCIVAKSPADQAGLRAGDFLISVNGLSVSKITHDAVVKLIGNSIGRIKMSIAEYYYSDSSDEEMDPNRLSNNRKPKYMHKPRTRKLEEKEIQKKTLKKEDASTSNSMLPAEEGVANTIEFKALVGYLGTIEMPKQLVPNSRLQTVCSCIRKLRQEKRTPSTVLITVLPSCLSLKNANNQILAIFPSVRVVYISSSNDKDSRYFGLVTSAICEEQFQKKEIEISNSCHVFVTDPKLVDHSAHIKKAENFNITCTPDIITGNCLEFPKNSLYVVSLIQNMYRLQNTEVNKHQLRLNNDENLPLMANSPQPSASSNSDSGIGFRDDCGNVSDRILVVEFPVQRAAPVQMDRNNRPTAIDGSNIPDSFDLGENSLFGVDNIRAKENMKKNIENENGDIKSKDENREGVLNIRAFEGKLSGEVQRVEQSEFKQPKDHLTKKPPIWNRLTVRAMPDPMIVPSSTSAYNAEEQHSIQQNRIADIDTGQIFTERPIDVSFFEKSEQNAQNFTTHYTSEEMLSMKGSVDNISVHSAKSFDLSTIKTVFKRKGSDKKKALKLSSCENLSTEGEVSYKLSPKVYGVDWSKPTSVAHSCEELNTLESASDCRAGGVSGSLQDLWSWGPAASGRTAAAVSEPDVRYQHHEISDQDDLEQVSDKMFLHVFKMMVSCKNIYQFLLYFKD